MPYIIKKKVRQAGQPHRASRLPTVTVPLYRSPLLPNHSAIIRYVSKSETVKARK